MKSLILILCIAFAAAGPTAEQLKTLATLLQEHHYRFTRQVATTPYTETTSPTTTPATPPDGSETPATAEPNTEFTTIFSRPECLRASERIVQSCVVAHGLSVDDLSGGNNSYDERLFYAQQSEIFCRDSRCQEDFFRFYEICIGSEKILSIVRQSIQASCSVNNNGTLCYNVFASSFGANSQIEVVSNVSSCATGVCTQECLEGLTGLSELGCCANEFFRVVETSYAAVILNRTSGLRFEGLWDICGLQDPGYCTPGTHTIASDGPSTGTPPTSTTHTSTEEPSISTTFVTPTPIYTTYPTSTPPTVSPKSKCAKRAKALSADQACSGGVDYYTDILKNGSVGKDLARMAELHSYLCSSQRCFNKYVKTYRTCLIALSGPERDFSVDRFVYKTFVPFLRKVYCARKDREICATHHPEILRGYPGVVNNCSSSSNECSEDCCNVVRNATEKYGCCFASQVLSSGFREMYPRAPCLSDQMWEKCGVPKPGRCQVVLRDPRKRPKSRN